MLIIVLCGQKKSAYVIKMANYFHLFRQINSPVQLLAAAFMRLYALFIYQKVQIFFDFSAAEQIGAD